MHSNPFLYTLSMILFVAGIASCTSGTKMETPANGGIQPTSTDVRTISQTQFSSGAMEVGKLTEKEFHTLVKANGIFDVPPENKTTISAYFAGYIKHLTLLPGEAVKKGQVLFTMENPDYVQIQQKFLEAKGQLNYLQADYERQKTLMEDEVTSQKNFLKAESDYLVTKAQYQSLKKQLALMNVDTNTLTAENIRATIAVVAPLSGYITAVPVTQGMFLNPSDAAMTITNMADMHLELKVYEKDLPLLQEGQAIRAKLQNEGSKIFLGEVHFINKAIDPTNRSIDVHGDLINIEDVKLLTPGMYVEAEIVTDVVKHTALPEEAIATIENNNYVLVKENDTVFRRKLVRVGSTYNGFTHILNATDFDPDTEFLTKGTFQLIKE